MQLLVLPGQRTNGTRLCMHLHIDLHSFIRIYMYVLSVWLMRQQGASTAVVVAPTENRPRGVGNRGTEDHGNKTRRTREHTYRNASS